MKQVLMSAALACAALMMAGCAGEPSGPPGTAAAAVAPMKLGTQIGAGYLAVDTAARLGATAKLGGQLSDDGARVLAQRLNTAITSLDTIQALAATNPAAAQTGLQQVVLALTLLQTTLQASGAIQTLPPMPVVAPPPPSGK